MPGWLYHAKNTMYNVYDKKITNRIIEYYFIFLLLKFINWYVKFQGKKTRAPLENLQIIPVFVFI